MNKSSPIMIILRKSMTINFSQNKYIIKNNNNNNKNYTTTTS